MIKTLLLSLLLATVAISLAPEASASCVDNPALPGDFCTGDPNGGYIVPDCWTEPNFTIRCEWG